MSFETFMIYYVLGFHIAAFFLLLIVFIWIVVDFMKRL